jgi:Phosphatidylinositol-glycan biosynthesis class S protein
VIFLGLPLWWKTTNIYRAKLPLELMDEWSDGKVPSLFLASSGECGFGD